MTQTSNRVLDELARLMTDAAGVARGIRGEVETVMRTQAERILRDLDMVQREEFEAVRLMAQKARADNDALAARVAALEARLGIEPPAQKPKAAPKAKAAPKRRAAPKAAAESWGDGPSSLRRKPLTAR